MFTVSGPSQAPEPESRGPALPLAPPDTQGKEPGSTSSPTDSFYSSCHGNSGQGRGARFCKIMVVEKLLWACVPCHGVSMETRAQTDQTETALGVPQGDRGASPQPSPQNGVLLLAEGTWTCPHVTERPVLHSARGQDVGGGRDPRTDHPGARGLHPNFLSPACVHTVRKGRITGHGGCSLICITHVHTHSHTCTRIHTYIHTRTHAHVQIHTRTHTLASAGSRPGLWWVSGSTAPSQAVAEGGPEARRWPRPGELLNAQGPRVLPASLSPKPVLLTSELRPGRRERAGEAWGDADVAGLGPR